VISGAFGASLKHPSTMEESKPPEICASTAEWRPAIACTQLRTTARIAFAASDESTIKSDTPSKLDGCQ
jgi:hypothetical protein